MSIPLTVNGAVFEYPVDFDENWGVDATGWAQAVTNGMLQMQGGSFPLTANVNFGPNFGLLSQYFQTRSASPATTGTVRLSSADAGVAWRNNANSANLVLTTNASDQLLYNGNPIATTSGAVTSITGTTNQIIASSSTGAITLSAPQDIAPASSPTFNRVTHTTDLVLKDSVSANLTVKAPTTLSTPWTFTYPVDDGLSGQVLQTDGSGNTSWVNSAGSGTVNSGTAGEFAYYAASSNVVSSSGVDRLAPTFTGLVTGNTFRATQSTNQLSFTGGGGGNQLRTINVVPTTNVGTLVQIPVIAASTTADVVLTEETQTINGVKTFSSSPLVPNATLSGQAAAFGQVPTVSGTTNTIPKFTASTTLGNSSVTDSGSSVRVSTALVVGVAQSGTPFIVNAALSGATGAPMIALNGSSGGISWVFSSSSQVGTFGSATTIATFSTTRSESHTVQVSGRDTTGGRHFSDNLIVSINNAGTASTPSVYATATVGSPAARTYSMNGTTGQLQLTMTGGVSYTLGVLDTYST